MVSASLSQRMRKLQTKLLAIRLGSGALVLPKDVKRLHLRFAPKMNGGHMGPRQFWRHELVRLKYHNPALPITLDRTAPQTDQALLSIHFAPENSPQTSSSPTSSPAPASDSTTPNTTPTTAAPTDRVEMINMTHSSSGEILEALTRLTKAVVVEATVEEREELRVLEEQRVRSLRDKKVSQEVRERQRRERELLEQARGDVAAASA